MCAVVDTMNREKAQGQEPNNLIDKAPRDHLRLAKDLKLSLSEEDLAQTKKNVREEEGNVGKERTKYWRWDNE